MNRMRMARLAGTAVLAAGLAVAFVPTAAAGPTASDALLTAMQRDLGLTAEQAHQRIAQEERAQATGAALTGALGSSFGGSWFDASSGKLVVAVTDASRIHQVESAGATAKVVSRSFIHLEAVKRGLDRAEKTAPASVTGWYVDVQSNSVVASVLGSDQAGLAWAAAWGARTESVSVAPQPLWSIIGGQAITTGGARCSAGFNARNSAGTRFVITAGHCTNIGTNWNGVGGTLGRVAGSSFPGNDYGIIQVTSSAAVSTALVDRYSAGADATVAGSVQQNPGATICRSGSTTGWRCGTIGAHNQTVRYPQGTVTGLTRTSACAQPGDSGGSFVSPNSTRVQAQGITSGGSGNCSTGGTTFHQPVNEVLGRFSLTLFTG